VAIAWFLLTVFLGTIGALALLRTGERLVLGGGSGSIWAPLILGPLCLFGAWKSFRKARPRP
jgi:hypothetical protein